MTTSLKPLGIEKKWAAEFRRGRECMEDYEQSGYPIETTTDENVELVHILIMCDRRRYLLTFLFFNR